MNSGSATTSDAARVEPARERLVLGTAQGPSLAELVHDRPMGVREAARVGADTATLLSLLHDRGRAHGAVSLTNVLLSPDGRGQLADVEVSPFELDPHAEAGRNRPADDVHDLATVLIKAITGRSERAADLPAELPRTMHRLLESATDPDPERRPSARQFADVLNWQSRAASAGPEPPWWSTSRNAAFAFGGVALLLVLFVLLGTTLLNRSERAGVDGTVATSTSTAPAAPTSTTPTATPTPTPTTTAPTSTPTPTVTPTPTATPTPTPTSDNNGPSIPFPTFSTPTLPALATTLPALPTALPELPAEAQGLFDRFVEWLKSLF